MYVKLYKSQLADALQTVAKEVVMLFEFSISVVLPTPFIPSKTISTVYIIKYAIHE